MKAFRTKHLSPTNTKPARIVAYDNDGNRVIISKSSAKNKDPNIDAALALCAKMEWKGKLVQVD